MFSVWLCDKFNWDDTIKDEFLKVKSPKITDKKVVESEELISADELHMLLRHANNSRDKCLIALCFEAGMRISEALTIKIKHIEILDTHMNIRLKGTKTENANRRITIIDSQNFVLNWLNDHPYRNDPESPLFVNISKNYGSPLRYDAAKGVMNRILKRAGLRHINWHLFRHTAATTEAVRGMNPKLMNKKFGWNPNSKTPFIYIALSENDLEEYELERKGIVIPEKEERERALEPKVCPRCGKINEATAIVCNQCGSALDPKILAQMIEEKDETFDTLKEELEQMKQQNIELMEQMKELFKMMNEKDD
jgi:ribosomal protein L40E